MEKTSITKILEELRENNKLKRYAPRTLINYYGAIISKDGKTKEEKAEIKKRYKNKNGHYEVDEKYKPYFSAIFQGYDKELVFYQKIIQTDGEIFIEEIKEAFDHATGIFSEECVDEEHIQDMIFAYDEFAGYSLMLSFDNIQTYLQTILANTYDLNYLQKVIILKDVEGIFKNAIFPKSMVSTITTSLYNEFEEMRNKVNK